MQDKIEKKMFGLFKWHMLKPNLGVQMENSYTHKTSFFITYSHNINTFTNRLSDPIYSKLGYSGWENLSTTTTNSKQATTVSKVSIIPNTPL